MHNSMYFGMHKTNISVVWSNDDADSYKTEIWSILFLVWQKRLYFCVKQKRNCVWGEQIHRVNQIERHCQKEQQ